MDQQKFDKANKECINGFSGTITTDKQNFDKYVAQFESTFDRNGNQLQMHSFAIKQHDNSNLHRFNKCKEFSDVRSLSKTVLALVTGKVIDLSLQGQYSIFDEDTYILPIIKNSINLTNKDSLDYLEKVQLKHLLTHTVGYDKMLLMRGDVKNIDPFSYLDHLINQPIKHEPGTYFLYSNAGFYLLSVVLQEFIKEDLFTFVERELFEPLGIKNAKWEKYGNYLAGATRLWLQPEDLINIGELLLNKGKFNDVQILAKSWIEKTTEIKAFAADFDSKTIKNLRHYAYGYGIWIAKENLFFGSGTDGQFIVIVPNKNLIIITQAVQKDTDPIKQIIDNIVTDSLS